MPEISRFLGIVITMYYREHPPAHFHARYGSFRITVAIDDGAVEGTFPARKHTSLSGLNSTVKSSARTGS